MPVNVKISDELVAEAKRYSQVYHRSLPKQIEYWSRIGKMAEENPDLPYSLIKNILLAREEADLEEYQFG
ncbi:MAG: ParD-like family protein [Magnetococcales bacterium]|nr:ParD-like family protein [Magnetococcales bacterium]